MAGKRNRILPGWMQTCGSPNSTVSKESAESKETASPLDSSYSDMVQSGTGVRKSEEIPTQTSDLRGQLKTVALDMPRESNDAVSVEGHQPVDTLSEDGDEDDRQEASPSPVIITDTSHVGNKQVSPNCSNTLNGDVSADDTIASDNSNVPNNRGSPAHDGATSPSSRQSCYYGSGCYRKNPQHRKEFSHPGDADYIQPSTSKNDPSSKTDNRPLCKYGAACYRKNPQHRLDFSHDVIKGRKARPTDLKDFASDEDEESIGECSDDYKPDGSETDESFITSDSLGSGESDFDPENEDDEEENSGKIKRKQKNKTPSRNKTKKKQKKEDE